MTAPLLARQDEAAFRHFSDQLPHALIVAGEAGLDRTAAVDALVHATPSDTYVLVPDKAKKHISVEQVRVCIATLRTYASRRRVIIVRLAEYMTETAQNALLKALEEPSPHTHFILESEQPAQLLSTVLSRCQVLQLHRTSSLQDNTLLKQTSLDDVAKQQIRFLAAGRPELIRTFIHTPKKLIEQREIIEHAKTIMSGSPYKALVSTGKYSANRDQALALLDVIITLIRFQLKAKGHQAALISLLERAETATRALRANGNVKLALLQVTS